MNQNWDKALVAYLNDSNLNVISPEQAIQPEYIGQTIFEAPIWCCGDPNDSLFTRLKSEVIGSHFRLPHEWNEQAQSVVSIFFPFTESIVKSNNLDRAYPSDLWLHGRIEGQACLNDIGRFLIALFESQGHHTVCPCISKDFFAVEVGETLSFTSNWSERHVAYTCGLGTFGRSKGIITEKGMAGRLLSIVTAADIPKNERPYSDIYEYCNGCNACTKVCPADAISVEHGKEHIPCSQFIDEIKVKAKPRYGCGKCQTLVPCARRIPKKRS